MNEVLVRKYIKKVMRHGVPKLMAVEIVETAIDVSSGMNLDVAINYALDLTYGVGFTKRANGFN